jgi:hypothetical protein
LAWLAREPWHAAKHEVDYLCLFQVEPNYHGWQIGWHPQFPLAADGPPIPGIIPPMPIPGIIPIPGNCPSTALATPSFDSKTSSELAMATATMLSKTIAAVEGEHL